MVLLVWLRYDFIQRPYCIVKGYRGNSGVDGIWLMGSQGMMQMEQPWFHFSSTQRHKCILGGARLRVSWNSTSFVQTSHNHTREWFANQPGDVSHQIPHLAFGLCKLEATRLPGGCCLFAAFAIVDALESSDAL